MSVGFGFSVGDVVAIIGVIRNSVKAFSETKGASVEFKNLVEELCSLEGSLEAIESLQLDSLKSHQAAVIQKVVDRCHRHIDALVREIAKYQPWLTPKSKGTKASVGKIKWALCKKNDIIRFRDQMAHQKSTVQILLLAQQANQTFKIEENQKTSMKTITAASLVSDHTHKEVLAINAGVNKLSIQCSRAQKDNQKAMEQLYRQIGQFRALIQMHQELPPQILMEKPVILKDACGKVYPFHLEFVTCIEALIAVLKVRFRQQVTSRDIQKLDRGEYAFLERNRVIFLREPWESVFKPGQTIDMFMIWPLQSPRNTCPYCLAENESANGDIRCINCNLLYNIRLEEFDAPYYRSSQRFISDHESLILVYECPILEHREGFKRSLFVSYHKRRSTSNSRAGEGGSSRGAGPIPAFYTDLADLWWLW